MTATFLLVSVLVLTQQAWHFILIFNILIQFLSEHGIKSCPKIYNGTPSPGFFSFVPDFNSELVEALETCCSSNIECDVRKRSEINGTSIEKNLRHCECEHEFYKCLRTSNYVGVLSIANHYFRKTQKCYAFDHPVTKCEQFKCFYQPNKLYKQYPSEAEIGTIRCAEYELDKSKPKIYQTFELSFTYGGYDALDYQTLEDNASLCGPEQ